MGDKQKHFEPLEYFRRALKDASLAKGASVAWAVSPDVPYDLIKLQENKVTLEIMPFVRLPKMKLLSDWLGEGQLTVFGFPVWAYKEMPPRTVELWHDGELLATFTLSEIIEQPIIPDEKPGIGEYRKTYR